jgi:predicted kinase
VATLIVVNGPPGIGKSTIARRYVEDRPLALCLDIDLVRGLLGDWAADPQAAGLAARAMALEMARVHLLAGHDVVVPQYIGRPPFLDQLENLAAQVSAGFREVVLMDGRAGALARHAARGGDPAVGADMYDRLNAFLASRPPAMVIPTLSGEVDAAYGAVLLALS